MESRVVKIVTVGDGAVGKTSMLISYVEDRFPEDYIPTIFDNHNATVMWDHKVVNLGLWDTAGQVNYENLRPLAYPNTDIFLICYSVVDPLSYENVKYKWAPEVRSHCPDAKFILVGTKLDIRDDPYASRKKGDPVSFDEGVALQKTIGALEYVECSARSGAGLKYVFHKCMEHVIGRTPIKTRQSVSSSLKRKSGIIRRSMSTQVRRCSIM
ncbi:RAC1 [Acrasis kona]|uniref:RAC1 n=1 Tax=Acrasis kona TaxID=1008807 RepID=A0AAW2Z822_9EUKA